MVVTIQLLEGNLDYQVLVDGKVLERIYARQDGQAGILDIYRTSISHSCAGAREVTRQIGRVTAECAQKVLLEHAKTDAWILNSFKR